MPDDRDSSLAFYSPTQKRDGDGQWTDGPGGGGGGLSGWAEKVPNLKKMSAAQSKELWADVTKLPPNKTIAENTQRHERIATNDDGQVEWQYENAKGGWSKAGGVGSAADLRGSLKNTGWKLSDGEDAKAETGKEAYKPKSYDEVKNANKAAEKPEKAPRAENLPDSFTAGALTHEEALADRDKALSKRKNPWTEDGELTESLAVYSEAGFGNLNNALRNDETEIDEGAWGGTSKVRDFTRQLDKTMYPLPRETTLFRQVGLNAFGLTNINDVKALEGQEFFDKAYVSTSLDPLNSIDDDSSSPVRIRITAPKGTRAAYIADISSFEEEQETLLGRGTRFRVGKVTMDEYGRALVEMEVIK